MIFCGYVFAPSSKPIVYFIVSNELIYIGETQANPVIRWNNHLLSQGSFKSKIEIFEKTTQVDYLEQPLFLCFDCSFITEKYPKIQWKTATQAIEHELHCFVLGSHLCFRENYQVISDTEKTAPRKFRDWDFAKEKSAEIFSLFLEEIEKIKVSQT